jgi:hypothetical protein
MNNSKAPVITPRNAIPRRTPKETGPSAATAVTSGMTSSRTRSGSGWANRGSAPRGCGADDSKGGGASSVPWAAAV